MNRYKNLTDQPLFVAGAGFVGPGETLETALLIENPNLEPEAAPRISAAPQVTAPPVAPQIPSQATQEAS